MPIEGRGGIEVDKIKLGDIGQEGKDESNAHIAALVAKLEKYVEKGALKPMEYEMVEGKGFESVLEGLKIFGGRKVDGKKLVVRVSH